MCAGDGVEVANGGLSDVAAHGDQYGGSGMWVFFFDWLREGTARIDAGPIQDAATPSLCERSIGWRLARQG